MERGSECTLHTGKHIRLPEHCCSLLPKNTRDVSLFVFIVVTEACFYHYQYLSFRVTPGLLVSKSAVVCVSLHVSAREFVLIRIKELFSQRKI